MVSQAREVEKVYVKEIEAAPPPSRLEKEKYKQREPGSWQASRKYKLVLLGDFVGGEAIQDQERPRNTPLDAFDEKRSGRYRRKQVLSGRTGP